MVCLPVGSSFSAFGQMSCRRRDLIREKQHLPSGRYLPEIIKENSKRQGSASQDRGKNNLGEDGKSERGECKQGQKRMSITSAASNRFQDLYYKYDWPSLSDTDSQECLDIGSSGSSASSMFSWADPNGTQLVAEEWEKIQRTLYDEEGPKVHQQHLLDECNQWKLTFPHLRVVGAKCKIKNQNAEHQYDSEEEVFVAQYENYDDNQILAQNSKLHRSIKKKIPEKRIISKKSNHISLVDKIDSYLHISPVNSSKMANRIGTSNSIIRSEISSSRWRHDNVESPDFTSLPYHEKIEEYSRHTSAISSYSAALKSNNLDRLSVKNKIVTNSDSKKIDKKFHVLEPIEPILISKIVPVRILPDTANLPKSSNVSNRLISLPPLQYDDNKVYKNQLEIRQMSGMNRYKRNKSLTPIDCMTVSKIGNDVKMKETNGASAKKLPSNKKKRIVKPVKKPVLY